MTITIVKYDVDSPETRELYDVTFFGTVVETIVTDKASVVTSWINNLKIAHRRHLNRLVVGLDVEWRPNTAPNSAPNPAATLQLCAGESCLVFQLLYARKIPSSLAAFLSDENHTFVGVGIDEDARKLRRDHGLEVENCVDLGFLARARYGKVVRKGVGLKELAEQSLGTEFEKPKTIATSRWDKPWLSDAQVKYACVDAFVSYKVGMDLDAAGYTELYKKFLRRLRVNLDCTSD